MQRNSLNLFWRLEFPFTKNLIPLAGKDKLQIISEGRSGKAYYQYGEHTFGMYWEISGVSEYDLLFFFESVTQWSVPAGKLIAPEEKAVLRKELMDCLKKQRIRAELV